MSLPLSASSILDFINCPQRYRLKHVEHLQPIDTPEALRIGTVWGLVHEVYANRFAEPIDPEMGVTPEEVAFNAATRCLNTAYQDVPHGADPVEWAVEREKLMNSFAAYQEHWRDDPLEVIASEISFELPIGRGTHREIIRGRVDQIVRWHDKVCILERKSTSKSLTDQNYWAELSSNIQTQVYALAARQGIFDHIEGVGKIYTANLLYDVWHKPTIRPKLLSAAQFEEFKSSGDYYNQHLDAYVEHEADERMRESPKMYGARLLSNIHDDPKSYFVRREIPQLNQELEEFEKNLVNIARAIKGLDVNSCWWKNPLKCREYGTCPFLPICSGCSDVCNGHDVPDGFMRRT